MNRGYRYSRSIALANYYADTRNTANFMFGIGKKNAAARGVKPLMREDLTPEGNAAAVRQNKYGYGENMDAFRGKARVIPADLKNWSSLAVRDQQRAGMRKFNPYDLTKGYGWQNRAAQAGRSFNRLGMLGKAGVVGGGLAAAGALGAGGYYAMRGQEPE